MTASALARTERGTVVPRDGEPFVSYTADGVDYIEPIKRVIRQNDASSATVWTIHDGASNLAWIRYDEWRGCWVRSYGQGDGEPVPFTPRTEVLTEATP